MASAGGTKLAWPITAVPFKMVIPKKIRHNAESEASVYLTKSNLSNCLILEIIMDVVIYVKFDSLEE